jgi:TRAP-type C4-dicarboxylate transport system substrate-binding protein
VDVKYVYNIMDLGYRTEDILWLVEDGVLTLGYQSSSYFTDRVPDLGVADLPFIFPNTERARAAIDSKFGSLVTRKIEERMNYRILGYYENGFRHVSNRLRPVRIPADLKGMRIRVLPSKIQARTFELLGAVPLIMDLTEALARIPAGTLDAQENPFANTVTYGVHKYHHFHTATNHFYLSRPIFLHRTSFEAWPAELQSAMRNAVREAVMFQRGLHLKEEEDAAAAIRKEDGEIIELTPGEHDAFVAAVKPLYQEVRGQFDPDMLAAVGL